MSIKVGTHSRGVESSDGLLDYVKRALASRFAASKPEVETHTVNNTADDTAGFDKSSVAAFVHRMQELQQELDKNPNTISTTVQEIAIKWPKFHGAISKKHSQFQAVANDINTLTTEVSSLDVQITTLNTNLTEIDNEIDKALKERETTLGANSNGNDSAKSQGLIASPGVRRLLLSGAFVILIVVCIGVFQKFWPSRYQVLQSHLAGVAKKLTAPSTALPPKPPPDNDSTKSKVHDSAASPDLSKCLRDNVAFLVQAPLYEPKDASRLAEAIVDIGCPQLKDSECRAPVLSSVGMVASRHLTSGKADEIGKGLVVLLPKAECVAINVVEYEAAKKAQLQMTLLFGVDFLELKYPPNGDFSEVMSPKQSGKFQQIINSYPNVAISGVFGTQAPCNSKGGAPLGERCKESTKKRIADATEKLTALLLRVDPANKVGEFKSEDVSAPEKTRKLIPSFGVPNPKSATK